MATEWISAAQAGAIVGCSRQTIDHYVRAGLIERRYPLGRKTPSISRESVESFIPWWEQHVAEAAARRRPPDTRPPAGPPDDDDVWLDATTAGLVAGVSTQYICRLAQHDRIPAVRDPRRRKWWIRRSHVEQYAAARAMRQLGGTADALPDVDVRRTMEG